MKSKGFTIVEILVSIGILSILLTLSLMSINIKGSFQKAHDETRKSDLNMLHKAFVQYFVDHRCYPTAAQWQAVSCSGPVPDEFKNYMSSVPCDPETGEKYHYEPLDKDCHVCNGGCGVCVGLRFLTRLEQEKDYSGKSAGCDPILGCGKSDTHGNVYNYGVSTAGSYCSDEIPLPTTTATLTPTSTNTPTQSPTHTSTPTPSPSFSPTPTPLACTPRPTGNQYTCQS